MQHADGEIHAPRAAEKFSIPFTPVDHEHLLHRGHCRAHQRAVLVPALYMMRDRDAMARMIQRAKDAAAPWCSRWTCR